MLIGKDIDLAMFSALTSFTIITRPLSDTAKMEVLIQNFSQKSLKLHYSSLRRKKKMIGLVAHSYIISYSDIVLTLYTTLVADGTLGIVDGVYSYHHYMQDNFNDDVSR